ncbi:ASCH/PUA domain-containing protein [Ancylomarina sp.]|uniref:ASCH/PUA domain-containing protein n=1 Tax=Ancylomarina sp. TaxID=1970196 RepID=UPI00356A2D41
MTHNLKIYPEYFVEVLLETKPFEVRKNDQDFKIGDTLHLLEYCPEEKKFTGDSCARKVSYVLKGGSFGIEKGYVVLGLQNELLEKL